MKLQTLNHTSTQTDQLRGMTNSKSSRCEMLSDVMITHQIQTDKMTRSVYQPADETQFTICNTLQLLGDIADTQSMSPFSGLYVSRSCIVHVHCTQIAETRFFTRQPHLSQIVLTFGIHQSTPSSLNLPQSDPPPVDLS